MSVGCGAQISHGQWQRLLIAAANTMKLTFRTVSGESFQLEAGSDSTVGALKAAVVQARSIEAADTMKLVYK